MDSVTYVLASIPHSSLEKNRENQKQDWGLSKLDTVSGFRTSFKGSNILRDRGSVFAVKGSK